jgi:uncharacterized protein YbjT (DUF2867 family)
VNVTVFGATGVVGRALLPLLGEHELTAVSRTARDEPGARYVVADAASGDGVAAALEGTEVVILGLVKRLPVMVTPSRVSTPTQPIALDDIARYLAGGCGNEATYGEGYDTGGPDVMAREERIRKLLPLQLTSFDEAARRALA